MKPLCRTGLDPVSAHDHIQTDCGDRVVRACCLSMKGWPGNPALDPSDLHEHEPLAACFESDLILTAPARVIGRLAEVYGLRAVRPPILMDAFEVRQYWHARNQDAPPHRWLRQLLHKVLSARM